jgi:hypothetical protein
MPPYPHRLAAIKHQLRTLLSSQDSSITGPYDIASMQTAQKTPLILLRAYLLCSHDGYWGTAKPCACSQRCSIWTAVFNGFTVIIIIIIIIIIIGMTALCEPWPSSGLLNSLIFTVWGCQPHARPPNWRTRVSLFVWLLPLDLSGLGGPTSSYATTGRALRVSGALKPHHGDMVGIAHSSRLQQICHNVQDLHMSDVVAYTSILLIPCSERRFSLQFIMTCNMHFTMNIQWNVPLLFSTW